MRYLSAFLLLWFLSVAALAQTSSSDHRETSPISSSGAGSVPGSGTSGSASTAPAFRVEIDKVLSSKGKIIVSFTDPAKRLTPKRYYLYRPDRQDTFELVHVYPLQESGQLPAVRVQLPEWKKYDSSGIAAWLRLKPLDPGDDDRESHSMQFVIEYTTASNERRKMMFDVQIVDPVVSKDVVFNSFTVGNNDRLVPGGIFTVHLSDSLRIERVLRFYLKRSGRPDSFPLTNVGRVMGKDRAQSFQITIPYWAASDSTSLGSWIRDGFWTSFWGGHKAELYVEYTDLEGKVQTSSPFDVSMADPVWAWILAIFTVVISTVLGSLILTYFRNRYNMEIAGQRKYFSWRSILMFPFELSRTPANRYSLSLFQVIIWTYVMMFGMVFVWKSTRTFPEVTSQILVLIGIGGGTAAASRLGSASRLRDIPFRWRRVVAMNHEPSLSDLLSEGGRASVPKFQMLVFTIIIAVTVLQEVWNYFQIPVLPEGLVTLMGVSGAVYLGNTLVQDMKPEDVKARIAEVDNYLAANNIVQKEDDTIPPDIYTQTDIPDPVRKSAQDLTKDMMEMLRLYLS